MSYARKNDKDSDIYIVRISDKYNCYACKLYEDLYPELKHISMSTLGELWDHLIDYEELGHMVPQRTLNRVSLELENFTT